MHVQVLSRVAAAFLRKTPSSSYVVSFLCWISFLIFNVYIFSISQEHFSNISFEAQDFIQNLLRAPSNKRLPLELCKNHTWLQSRGDYNSHLDPGNPLSRLDTERLQNFVTRRKNVEGDVKLLPEDLETLCIETWTNAIG